ncbi:MAG: phage portal protein [Chloracidobacterium sp.]|nr:phage portal protein [Chloracidobacterium sp.]
MRDAGCSPSLPLYNPLRVSATRGVTALAPIFQISGMFEDVNFAKVVQAQVVSCFAIFRKRELKSDAGLPSTSASYGSTEIEQTAGGDRLIDNLEPGAELKGAPGESFEGFSPDVPNTNYFEHAKLL